MINKHELSIKVANILNDVEPDIIRQWDPNFYDDNMAYNDICNNPSFLINELCDIINDFLGVQTNTGKPNTEIELAQKVFETMYNFDPYGMSEEDRPENFIKDFRDIPEYVIDGLCDILLELTED